MNSPAGRSSARSPADEPELIRRFVRGDIAAFDEVAALYSGRVAALAYRLLAWNGDVDDLVQEVFLAALERRGDFRGESSLATWLTAITVNRCRSHWRRRRVRRLLHLDRAAGDSAADRPAIDRETSHQVHSAVGRLPPRLREVIVLYYLQEMPTAEICRVLGISGHAVAVRLHRGRERLRSVLARCMEEAHQ